ncbi:hypothetical protein OG780_11530 [Streptomyces sp. NBC_00386]|uniref:hypothetical protein n=1 Tax=Streptomyces sp. NBC_00386 TaxID=2975734 RepID=UPI002E2199DA
MLLGTVVIVVGAAARPSVAVLIERLGQARSNAKIAREQRRMAMLATQSTMNLTHSVAGGPELIIRHQAPCPKQSADLEER